MASTLAAKASNLLAMASTPIAMASNLLAMASAGLQPNSDGPQANHPSMGWSSSPLKAEITGLRGRRKDPVEPSRTGVGQLRGQHGSYGQVLGELWLEA